MQLLKDPHQVAEQMKRREFNRHRRGAVGCLTCTGPPSYRRARFCPSPGGSPADVYFPVGDSPSDGSIFKLKEGGEVCYFIAYADATTTSPGTVYGTTDVVDISASCAACNTCGSSGSFPYGYLVEVVATPTSCCIPALDDRLPGGTFYNAQIHDPAAVCMQTTFVPMNGSGPSGATYTLVDNAVGTEVDFGSVVTDFSLPFDCSVILNTLPVSLNYTIDIDTNNNFTTFNIITSSPEGSETQLIDGVVPTSGANTSTLVPIVETDCYETDDPGDGIPYFFVNGNVSTRPVCTKVSATTVTITVSNAAQDVSFPFTTSGGSGDWYAIYAQGGTLPVTSNPFTAGAITSPTTGNGGSTLVVHIDANTTGFNRLAVVAVNINGTVFQVNQNA